MFLSEVSKWIQYLYTLLSVYSINDFLIKFQNTQPVKGQQCVNHALFILVLSMHIGNVIITYEKNAI